MKSRIKAALADRQGMRRALKKPVMGVAVALLCYLALLSDLPPGIRLCYLFLIPAAVVAANQFETNWVAATYSLTALSLLWVIFNSPSGVAELWMPFAQGALFTALRVWEHIVYRRASQGLLRDSQAFRDSLLHSALDSIVAFGADGRILEFNAAAEGTFGYKRDEIIGRVFCKMMLSSENQERFRLPDVSPEHSSLVFGQRFETTMLHKFGSSIPVDVGVVPTETEKGRVYTAYIRDLTDRRSIERAHQESERRYRLLVENGLGLICIHDLDGKLMAVNRAATESLEYDRDEILGTCISRFLAPEVRRDFPKYLEQLRTTGQAAGMMKLQTRQGEDRVWFYRNTRHDAEDGTSFVIGHAQDLTEQMRITHELRQSQEKFSNLFHHSHDGIILHDLEGTILEVNQKAIDLLGLPKARLMEKEVSELYPPEERPAFSAAMETAKREGTVTFETQFQRSGGGTFPAEVSASIFDLKRRKVIQGIIRDISEQKRTMAQLKATRDAAEGAARAKSDFLANMSHEIRTPMNAVIGMTGLLLETELSAQQSDYVQTIRGSGETLLAIINDILDFSKIESGKLELEEQAFCLRDCIEESLDLLSSQAAQKKLEIGYFIEPEVPVWVIGDVTRTRQVLVNLVSNAVKFTRHGVVAVTVSQDERGERESEIRFSVADTGIGIPVDRLDRLFTSFSQLDSSITRQFGGTGLGLAISRQLTEMMGGRIWVESEAGKGSTFHFTIRAHTEEREGADDLMRKHSGWRERRILLVSRKSFNQMLLRKYMNAWGLPAWCADSQDQALAWVRGRVRFDLLLADSHLTISEIAQIQDEQGTEVHRLPCVRLARLGEPTPPEQRELAIFHLEKPIKPKSLKGFLECLLETDGSAAVPHRTVRAIRDSDDGDEDRKRPLRILLAEDNPVNQKVAMHLLKRLGYRADIAANGIEAVEALQRQPYDLVFMDVQMPEMGGLEATRIIRRRQNQLRQPRIVAMTANAMQGDREACLAAGMDDYLSKPVRFEELRTVLSEASGHSVARLGESA